MIRCSGYSAARGPDKIVHVLNVNMEILCAPLAVVSEEWRLWVRETINCLACLAQTEKQPQ